MTSQNESSPGEAIKKVENTEQSPDSFLINKIKEIFSRKEVLDNKIGNRAKGVDALANTLPESEIGSLDKVAAAKARAVGNLMATASVTALMMGLMGNGAAFAEDDTNKVISPETQSELNNIMQLGLGDISFYTEAIKYVVEKNIKEKEIQNKKDIKTLGDETKKPQQKIDATFGLISNVPSRIMGNTGVILSSLGSLNDIQKDIRDPKVTKIAIVTKLGRVLVDLKTLGFGTLILDSLIKKDEPKTETVVAKVEPPEIAPTMETPNTETADESPELEDSITEGEIKAAEKIETNKIKV